MSVFHAVRRGSPRARRRAARRPLRAATGSIGASLLDPTGRRDSLHYRHAHLGGGAGDDADRAGLPALGIRRITAGKGIQVGLDRSAGRRVVVLVREQRIDFRTLGSFALGSALQWPWEPCSNDDARYGPLDYIEIDGGSRNQAHDSSSSFGGGRWSAPSRMTQPFSQTQVRTPGPLVAGLLFGASSLPARTRGFAGMP